MFLLGLTQISVISPQFGPTQILDDAKINFFYDYTNSLADKITKFAT